MVTTRKLNCWEFRDCERGPGTKNMCPAPADTTCDRANSGTNAGRICWCVGGTFCSGQPECDFAQNIDSCLSCKFFQYVQAEEGPRFQLLKLAQGVFDVSGLQAMISHLEAMMRIHERVHSHFDLEQAIKDITDEAKSVTCAQRSVVFLIGGNPPELRGEFTMRGERIRVTMPIDENSVVGFCALHNKAANLRDVYERNRSGPGEPRFNKQFDKRCRCETESLLAVPIRDSRQRVIGVITAANSLKGRFSSDDQWFLQKYATEVALAVEKSRLLEQSLFAARLTSVGETAAALSHCIKNIAHAMRGSAYVIKRGIELNRMDNVKAAWEILDRHVEKLADLSLDLLAFDPERALEAETADLNETVDHVVRLLTDEARTRSIKLEACLGRGVETCRFDPRLIYRCLINLIMNAFDACMPKAGTVAVLTGRTAQGDVMITVSDNGRGMDDRTKEQIFKLFKTSKGRGSFGIGLPTVLDLVKKHNGRIEVQSELGKGSTFTILIPDLTDAS
jgi:signal transduction histidine kinase